MIDAGKIVTVIQPADRPLQSPRHLGLSIWTHARAGRLGQRGSMTETSPAVRRWNRWTIWVPAAIAFGEASLLGTAGAFAAGFGLGTSCTDDFDCTGSCPPCTALYDWLKAGAVGQGVLAIAAVMLLVLGLARPAQRRRTAIAAWAIIVVAAVWYYVTTQLGSSSF